ncbi:unnamed protein product [Amoebophrya sp. A120]|nr:unnamed protein product [Amoebophrya sp. A120]|eukprot:GSA120T00020489001.1
MITSEVEDDGILKNGSISPLREDGSGTKHQQEVERETCLAGGGTPARRNKHGTNTNGAAAEPPQEVRYDQEQAYAVFCFTLYMFLKRIQQATSANGSGSGGGDASTGNSTTNDHRGTDKQIFHLLVKIQEIVLIGLEDLFSSTNNLPAATSTTQQADLKIFPHSTVLAFSHDKELFLPREGNGTGSPASHDSSGLTSYLSEEDIRDVLDSIVEETSETSHVQHVRSAVNNDLHTTSKDHTSAPARTVRDVWQICLSIAKHGVSFDSTAADALHDERICRVNLRVFCLAKLAKHFPWIWSDLPWKKSFRLKWCQVLLQASAEDENSVVGTGASQMVVMN